MTDVKDARRGANRRTGEVNIRLPSALLKIILIVKVRSGLSNYPVRERVGINRGHLIQTSMAI